MMKNYLQFIILFIGLALGYSGFAQNERKSSVENEITGLNLYPNPVNANSKLFINTPKNTTKTIEIFDVLGKKVFETRLNGNAIDISQITSGVYIIKITQNNITATRKLIIR
ncbi:putative secreted protein (Por secretion system target) [Flavobacteriaceae bacterium MAR_2010_72]|nr:putative secreted protein (Por secretion system target) [Flavobacteriaceae bacterium MAR_2010_72]TVZ58016.1 putative secreted protein (Por secretion system target) [Flavobacteriaceae bacterium MAR_2010_105]